MLPSSLPGKIHNGIFTVKGPKGHRTFKVATVLTESSALYGKRIVYIMNGTDNLFDYLGIGFLNDDDTVTIWKRQAESVNAKSVLAFASIARSPEKYKDYTLESAKHCLKCNRLLTNPESLASGIGPICEDR